MNSSLFLAARPSFLEGVARVIDLGGTLNDYNTSLDGDVADYLAVQSSWVAVGDAIRKAAEEFAAEHHAPPVSSMEGAGEGR